MSHQHPTFPPHLPRGAVAASALTLSKSNVTTVLRASPAIQIPAAPSVPSVSVSMPGLPTALVRNPVISAIRPATPPNTRAPSPAINVTDHPRTNLIVQGPPRGGAPLPGQPLQITLTQHVGAGGATVGMVNPGAPTISLSEAMKLTSLGPKTVQVPQSGLLAHQKLPVGAQPAPGSLAGIGMASHLQQQAVLAASKPGGLQASAAVPAVSISSLSAPMPTATVMAPASTSIPIVRIPAKVTPQRQQLPLTSALPTPIAVQTMTSGSDFTTVANLSTMATQTGAGQLLLSQTPRSQTGTVVTATTTVTLTNAIPTAVTSLAPQQQGERALAPTLFNLTATAAAAGSGGQGQENSNLWLQQIIYQQARAQLVHTTPNNPAPIMRTPAPSTFFMPRPGAEQAKLTNQTPNLAASLSHPTQSTMLFSAQMMVEGGLRPQVPQMPLNSATATMAAAAAAVSSSSVSTLATGVGTDGKPVVIVTRNREIIDTQAVSSASVISLSSSSGAQPGIHASLIAASTAASASAGQSDPHPFPSSTSLHMAANMVSGNTGGVSVLAPNLGLSAVTSLPSRATVASSLIAAATAHQAQASSSSSVQPQAPGTPGGSGSNTGSSASPRPSILRKRNVDGSMVIPRKPTYNLMADSHSPRPDTAPPSNISSPKTPATENSQSSTDTALSNDATTPTHTGQGEVKIKSEGADNAGENGASLASPAVSQTGSNTDMTPRKRARKQLFEVSHRTVSEEVKGDSSTDEDSDSKSSLNDIKQEHPLEQREEYIDEEGVRWTKKKTKPNISIMSDYSINWKPKLNHFQRASDVRPKEDRNPTVNELISQRGILQKASGWRLHYVSTQLEEVIENEQSMEHRMEKLKERLSAISTKSCTHSSYECEYNKLLELTRGNLQRCQVVRQQMQEAKANMLNLLKHEPKIKEIITKNLAKRTIKKKERT